MRFEDVHMCKFCKRRPDEDGILATYDFNGCMTAADILYDEDGRYVFSGSGNDREFRRNGRLVFKTVDNGGGYNVVRCPKFNLDYDKYIKSEEWKEVREEREFLDGLKCRFCGSAKNLTVHHITYENVPNEDMTDLVTLCWTCHNELHKYDDIRKKRSFYLPADYRKR